uniref:N-acetylglucosaminyl-phosphatidylinositol biosynthetic protein gpi1 n=1 Tax=Anthurium amnicola TaxID=1678845 RepID=A0A1D1Y9G5_9ARAE
MKGRQCRVWWPEQLSSREPSSHLLLFGWCMYSAFGSLDLVVAVGASIHELLPQLDLEEVLDHMNKKIPITLRNHSTLCLLGHCAVGCINGNSNAMDGQSNDFSSEGLRNNLQYLGMKEGIANMGPDCQNEHSYCDELYGKTEVSHCVTWNCGCHKLNRLLEKYRQSSIRNSNWIQLNSSHRGFSGEKTKWIPEVHHIHLNGVLLPVSHAHLILYELPSFGVHHFSSSNWSSLNHVGIPFKKPNWLAELYQKQSTFELDTVMLALNCANAVKDSLKTCLGIKGSLNQSSTMSMLTMAVWHMVAVWVASISTFLYIILQFFYRCFSHASKSLFYMILAKLFNQTWKNVHVRSCQLLYWPILLQGSGSSSLSSIEYAHRTALKKHAIWSSVAIDFLLGNIIGLVLWFHADDVLLGVSHVACKITDNLLRSGCVWLMGVPAGFKLNTELAELLGLVSLNAIQIWSTLWFYMGCLFRCFLIGLASSGMLLGMTIPAALCIDMLKLATLHMAILHWLISFLYSQQIWALTSLWRLFRGQKWNPLRVRLDSYDYTVEQHVVGSLLFTPIMLLLPTTSVFYIFFTIMTSTISFICIVIEVAISIHHATPYAEIFMWMVSKRRFPSGLWFKITRDHVSHRSGEDSELSSSGMVHGGNGVQGQTVVSFLQSNYASIGQIVRPHYRNIFPSTSGMSSVYGLLIGQRFPSTLGMCLPTTMPWMSIRSGEYWRLCRSSVLACTSKI